MDHRKKEGDGYEPMDKTISKKAPADNRNRPLLRRFVMSAQLTQLLGLHRIL